MSTWKECFPDYPAADMPPLPKCWVDVSWPNDSCPSFESESLHAVLYVDYVDTAKREFPEMPRFSVCALDDDGELIDQNPLAEGDDLGTVLTNLYIKTRRRKR